MSKKKSAAQADQPEVILELDALRGTMREASIRLKKTQSDYASRSFEEIQRAVAAGNLQVDPETAARMRLGSSMTPLLTLIDGVVGDIDDFILTTRLRLSGRALPVPEIPATPDRLACDHILTADGLVFGEKLDDGKMLIRKGSSYVRHQAGDLFDIHVEKRQALEGQGIVGPVAGQDPETPADGLRLEFRRDFVFDSPGEASAVACGVRHRRSEWRRISWPALIVVAEARGVTVSDRVRRASRKALGMIDPLDPKWEGRDGHSDECMIAEDDFRFGGMPFSIGARKVRIQERSEGNVDRARTNAMKSAALRLVCPGGRPNQHGKFMNNATRVVVASKTSENPWQFQINKAAMDWALDGTEEGIDARILLVFGWFGYSDFDAAALRNLTADLWRENDKGHEICWIEANRVQPERVELRPVPDRTRMLPLHFRTADTVELP